MFCKHCGQRIGRDEVFCVRCGQTISQEEFESDASQAPHPNSAPANMQVGARAGSPVPSIFELARETGNAVRQVEPSALPTVEEKPGPDAVSRAPRYVPARKNSFPIIEFLVAVLLVAGAVAAMFIFHSTTQRRLVSDQAGVTVTIAPTSATLRAGKSAQFSATVSGSNDNEVVWSVGENDAGGQIVPEAARAEGGLVSSLAIYTATRKPGTYHLRVSSKANPDSSATALITVRK